MTHKTVTVTWNDQRPERFGEIAVALWCAVGDDSDLNNALAYAAHEARKRGVPYRVHTWPTDEAHWRVKSAAAHRAGHGV